MNSGLKKLSDTAVYDNSLNREVANLLGTVRFPTVWRYRTILKS
jgi:hypothetical protein